MSDIEQVVRRWADAVVSGDTSSWDTLLGEGLDRAGIIARARAVADALDERRLEVIAQVIQGDRVAWRWALHGVHRRALAGVPATGGRATLEGVNFQRIEGGRVVEHWTLIDREKWATR